MRRPRDHGRGARALAAASAVNAAICDLDRAEVLRDAGLAHEAEQSLARVVGVFAAHRMRQAKGEAQFHLARSLITHDPGRGRRRGGRGDAHVPGASAASGGRCAPRPGAACERSSDRRPRRSSVRARVGADGRGRRHRRSRDEGTSGRCRRPAAHARTLAREHRDAPQRTRRHPHARGRAAPGAAARARGQVGARRARGQTSPTHDGMRPQGLDALAEWQRSFGSLDLATSLVMHGRGLIFAGLRSAVRSATPRRRVRLVGARAPPESAGDAGAPAARRGAGRRSRRAADAALRVGRRLALEPRAVELSERVRRRQWSSTGAAGRRDRISLDELRASLADDTGLRLVRVRRQRLLMAVAVVADDARVIEIAPWDRVRSRVRRTACRPRRERVGAVGAAGAWSCRSRSTSVLRRSRPRSRPGRSPRSATGARRSRCPASWAAFRGGCCPAMRGRAFTVATSASQWVADRGRATAPGVGFVAGPRVVARHGGGRARRVGVGRRHRPESGYGDRRCDLAARLARRHAAHRRARPACGREPAVLGSRARRRRAVRLRHRPHPAGCPTPSCSRRARSAAPRCAGEKRRSG